MIAACEAVPGIRVTKQIVADPLLGGGAVDSITASENDTVRFLIVVENVGGESVAVNVTDTFSEYLTGVFEESPIESPTWTRTNANDTTTTGSGDIEMTNLTLAAGERVSWLVDAVFSPDPCTSLVTNVVTVRPYESEACCDDDVIEAAAQVFNAEGPRPKLDPVAGFTAMEVLYHLFEAASISLSDKAQIADFINNCGTLADLLGGGGSSGDGPAVELTDAFGEGLDLFAETSVGF